MTHCCTHACNEGRDCPLRVRRRLKVTPLVMEIIGWLASRRTK